MRRPAFRSPAPDHDEGPLSVGRHAAPRLLAPELKRPRPPSAWERVGAAVFSAEVIRGMLAATALVAAYQLLPGLFEALGSDRPLLQWWAARATGFGAYVAYALSMIFGLMVSSRGLDGAVSRATVLEYHQQWAVSALLLTVAHVMIILADRILDFSVAGVLVPGLAAVPTTQLTLGILGLWGIVIVTVSSWIRARLSYRVWRVVHSLATGILVVSFIHGALAGADTHRLWAQVVYGATSAGVVGATIFRLLHEHRKRRQVASAPGIRSAPGLLRRAGMRAFADCLGLAAGLLGVTHGARNRLALPHPPSLVSAATSRHPPAESPGASVASWSAMSRNAPPPRMHGPRRPVR